MKVIQHLVIASLALSVSAAQAQLLSSPRTGLDRLGAATSDALDPVTGLLKQSERDALALPRLGERLAAARAARIGSLLRNHADLVELDERQEPARRGTILMTDADAPSLEALRKAGYAISSAPVEGLGLTVFRLSVPRGLSLARALGQVRKLAPMAQVSADNLYFPSGATAAPAGTLAPDKAVAGRAIGLIDGGVARHPALTGPIEQRGFADGAPRANAHGTAVASLISGTGMIRGAAPGAALLAADVYGADPAGGGAFAIARALGWMVARKVAVVTISLVGPDNPLLAGAIRLAREKGLDIVAAVGNDGPAAPPAYPASYPGVIAVTGIDGKNRLLPEAGRALHIDFAAPGADMDAARTDGGKQRVRGTSFAAPLVAGRLFDAGSVAILRAKATPAPTGKSRAYGYGIICGECRNIP